MKPSSAKPMIAAGIVASTRSQAIRRSGSVADASLAHARQPRADVAHPVAREVDEQRHQRAEMQEDVEGEAADQPIGLPARDPGRQLEVRRRADRDELGQALEEPDERGLEDDVQGALADEERRPAPA